MEIKSSAGDTFVYYKSNKLATVVRHANLDYSDLGINPKGINNSNNNNNNFGASGVPDGLDPEGVRIALEGGTSWGATDQARYDAWVQSNQPVVAPSQP